MKRISLICLLSLALSSLVAQEIVVECPPFSVTNTQGLEIEKIILSKERTVIHFIGYNHPGWGQRIDSKTYILANGEKLTVLSADGIELDKRETANEEGKLVFSLNFPPIDPNTRQIDFIESDCQDCFKIWGIELQSKELTNKVEVPAEFRSNSFDLNDQSPLPVVGLKFGNAILKGKLAGYKPEMQFKGEIYNTNPATGQRDELPFAVKEDGTFEIHIPVVSTTAITLNLEQGHLLANTLLVTPGEETRIFLDLQQKARQESRSRVDKTPESQWLYYGGANAEINSQEVVNLVRSLFNYQKLTDDMDSMDSNEYKSYILAIAEEARNHLKEKGLSRKALEFAEIQLSFTTNYHLMMDDYRLKSSSRKKHQLNYEDELTGYETHTHEADYFDFLKTSYINNPLALYSNNYHSAFNLCWIALRKLRPKDSFNNQRLKELMTELLGTDQGIFFDMLTFRNYASKLDDAEPFTESDFAEIAQLPNPFYPTYAAYLNEKLLAQIELNKGKKGYNVYEIPKTENAAILHEIIKPFKGKVIFIDFWATWCGPCRMAMKQFAPAKEQFEGKDVAFIYLTDPSSPKATWENMIADIPGEHFRLKGEQFAYLREKFGVKVAPSYLILNKKGEQVYFKVGFEGAEAITKILNRELEQ